MPVVSHEYLAKHREVVAALVRAQTILENMALENERGASWLWPIPHEPLWADAKALLPVIKAALTTENEND